MTKQGEQVTRVLLCERLPCFLKSPCELEVVWHVDRVDDFYVIHLHVQGILQILCQRCMEEFVFPYDNHTSVAVCRTDERAEQLLERYECIVTPNLNVVLEDLITDELHLYTPAFHPEITGCSSKINQILMEKG